MSHNPADPCPRCGLPIGEIVTEVLPLPTDAVLLDDEEVAADAALNRAFADGPLCTSCGDEVLSECGFVTGPWHAGAPPGGGGKH